MWSVPPRSYRGLQYSEVHDHELGGYTYPQVLSYTSESAEVTWKCCKLGQWGVGGGGGWGGGGGGEGGGGGGVNANYFGFSFHFKISNEEEVADNCRLRCEKQRIPFYRFNPVFDAESDVKILPTEIDVHKLSNLVLRAQEHIRAWEHQIDLLVNLVHKIDQRRRQTSGFTFKK